METGDGMEKVRQEAMGQVFFYRFTVSYKLDRKKVMRTQNSSELYLLSY